jgi:hypothetical protein
MSERTLIVELLTSGKYIARVSSTYNANHSERPNIQDDPFAEFDRSTAGVFEAETIEQLAERTAKAYNSSHMGGYWKKSPTLFVLVLGTKCGKITRNPIGANKDVSKMTFNHGEQTKIANPVAAIQAAVLSQAAVIAPLMGKGKKVDAKVYQPAKVEAKAAAPAPASTPAQLPTPKA